MKHYRFLTAIKSGAAAEFQAFLESLIPGEQYGIEVNSPGGDVVEGFYIYHKMLQRPPAQALIHQAASMSSLLAMAAKRRIIAEGGHLILHAPQVTMSGSAQQLKDVAEYTDGIEQEMKGIYQSRSKTDAATIAALMKSEKPVTSQRAMELGLVDEVLAAEKMAAMISSPATATKQGSAMGFKQMLAKLLGLPEASLAVNDKGEATAETQALLDAKAALLNQREQELNAAASVQAKSTLIAQALAAGRLTEAQSKLEAIAKLDVAALKTLIESMPVVVPLKPVDMTGLSVPSLSSVASSPEAGKILKALRVDPAVAAKITIPTDGVLRHVVTSN